MTSAVEQAIHLNNKAASLVSTGHLWSASRLLGTATNVLRQSVQHEVVQDKTSLSALTEMDVIADDTAVVFEPSEFNPPGMMHIQERLLCISSDLTGLVPRDDDDDDQCLLCVLSTLTLYNSAVVQHLMARVTGYETRTWLLLRAKALYERVLRVANTCHWPIQPLLHCLVLNNLADIHYELCDFEQSKHCLEILADIAQRTQCLDDCTLVSDEEVQGINVNYTLAQYPTAASAA
jgi:hypothetical protein